MAPSFVAAAPPLLGQGGAGSAAWLRAARLTECLEWALSAGDPGAPPLALAPLQPVKLA